MENKIIYTLLVIAFLGGLALAWSDSRKVESAGLATIETVEERIPDLKEKLKGTGLIVSDVGIQESGEFYETPNITIAEIALSENEYNQAKAELTNKIAAKEETTHKEKKIWAETMDKEIKKCGEIVINNLTANEDVIQIINDLVKNNQCAR